MIGGFGYIGEKNRPVGGFFFVFVPYISALKDGVLRHSADKSVVQVF
ncbi:hypothetical protein NEIFLAOT_01764 [Neisseria flavescens NRL30031/H210]|uniref:Uncharacterized protein n=1 Tax=Neisseria flavescens NRL30031/H210 TaxID=546264 RepID=C0EP74_NEIFL|nr:hypothetical protein NEIFLAOT_01764 [Neisseria flavescens NRL30031/H210]